MGISGFNAIENLDHDSFGVDVPVVIIGGGPAGLLQAHLLSQLGVKCLIVERYPERLGAPKAHALSPRSLEICRQFHLDVRKIRQLGTKRSDAFWVNFVTNLSGQLVGTLPYERMDVDIKMIHNIPQPVFEQLLTDVLSKDSNVDLRKGVSFVSLDQKSEGITTTVEERATGHRFQIHSRYLIACDGARSKVRSVLGVESDGEDSYETMMTIHFNADLRPIVGERVGMLHWIMDPLGAGFIIAYDLSGNAVLICNFDVRFRQTRSSLRGDDYRAGDAAHSFPPTGGLGLNSGIGDVHNLAYKIALVLKGEARDSLLETYESERRHVAVVNSMQSVKNGKQIFGLLKSLGIGNDLMESRKNLYATLQDPEKMKVVNARIEEQREHFDNLELHIGYVYGSEAIPPHASKYTPKFEVGARLPHTWIRPTKTTLSAVDVSYVDELSPDEVKARQYSTLDLCELDKFTLIGDLDVPGVKTCRLHQDFEVIGQAGQEWLTAAGLKDGGGLLIRPDQHILMVIRPDTTVESVQRVLNQHLGV
ncbi:uncharacterized protein Z518_06519 [Rhinocladiella mackenziei CBS 650.93]|uniref:FAD-binding domain-containing protein n=1 Tax=Rhinocladiella mackenziei CBS 650.93 TaxID=1442369 RepID=A0A0D2IAW6_9EURO|nr:uncharacterized protein Z518_06519 [Rhinocladiella mackenziei CBS 650.93]KIX02969.1 hypothetical protein Z518_06519 [Rhinocladiella mackenziei CBS 650.93]